MAKRIKIIVPIPMDEASVANRAKQLPKEIIADGFEVDFVAVKTGAALGDSYYDGLLMDMTVVEAGLQAQAQGYDAVGIDTISDSGLYALRSRLTIPVVGPGIVSLHIACMLGQKFSIVSMWDEWFHFYKKLLNEYALWPRLALMRSIRTRPPGPERVA